MAAAVADDSSDPFRFFRTGGKRIVNFTVTNCCNASCVYCSFHKQKNKKAALWNRPGEQSIIWSISTPAWSRSPAASRC